MQVHGDENEILLSKVFIFWDKEKAGWSRRQCQDQNGSLEEMQKQLDDLTSKD